MNGHVTSDQLTIRQPLELCYKGEVKQKGKREEGCMYQKERAPNKEKRRGQRKGEKQGIRKKSRSQLVRISYVPSCQGSHKHFLISYK